MPRIMTNGVSEITKIIDYILIISKIDNRVVYFYKCAFNFLLINIKGASSHCQIESG